MCYETPFLSSFFFTYQKCPQMSEGKFLFTCSLSVQIPQSRLLRSEDEQIGIQTCPKWIPWENT